MAASDHLSGAQFFHGTTWELSPGQVLRPKDRPASNFSASSPRHVYFTSHLPMAVDYGEPLHNDRTSVGRVYQVEPTTKKFHRDPGLRGPGYHWRDYHVAFRTTGGLRVVRELGEEDFQHYPREYWDRLKRNVHGPRGA